MSIPRLVIGAAQGRSGKTTVTLGLCAALRARGLVVQPFKKGPDYIDPSWLSEAAGRPCRTLDPFFCGDDERLVAAFLAGLAGADIAIVEGNHGLYDGVTVGQGSGGRGQESGVRGQGSGVRGQGSGVRGQGSGVRGQGSGVRGQGSDQGGFRNDEFFGGMAMEGVRSDDFNRPAHHRATEVATTNDTDDAFGSTAAVARALGAPILLVVNTARMGRSVAALVHGYQTFEPDTPIAGVILNNVARGRHEEKLRAAVEHHCGIPVLGALPRDEALSIPDRHLGLVPRAEDEGLLPAIAACRAAAERYFDLDAILDIARDESANQRISESRISEQRISESRISEQRISESRISESRITNRPFEIRDSRFAIRHSPSAIRLAVFRDRAFTFYYPENLEALEAAGAELVFVDAFRDTALPAVDALYIGGGFPEMFMEELASGGRSLLRSVRDAAEAGLPIYAECGGLMVLARRIIWGERVAEMAGVLPCDVEMTGRPQGHGYVEAVVDADNPFFPVGTVLRGHEFHNSRLFNLLHTAYFVEDGVTMAYRLNRGNGIGGGRDGLVYRNVLASYTHLHIAGAPTWAEGLIRAARNTQYAVRSTQYAVRNTQYAIRSTQHGARHP